MRLHLRVTRKCFCLVAVVAAVASCGTQRYAGAPQAGVVTSPATANPSASSALDTSPPLTGRFLPYVTGVNPGSAISFVNSQVGWRIDGQGPAAHLDEHLAAGPHATNFDWPGSAVSMSADGGHSWRHIYSTSDGIWGFDLLSTTVGVVIGVTSAAETTDGGATWRTIAEPGPHPLVSVDFVSATTGYGLTTPGTLVQTHDSGASWQQVNLPRSGGALCFTSATGGYVSGQDGSLFRTDDAGQTWTTVHENLFTSSALNLQPLWSTLACSGSSVWQGLTALTPYPPPGYSPFAVFASRDRGAVWHTLASNPDSVAPNLPVASGPFAHLAGIALASGSSAVLAGWPESGFTVATAAGSGSGALAATGRIAAQMAPAAVSTGGPVMAQDYLVVHGVSFVGQTGWLYLDDSAEGTADHPVSRMLLYQTVNGGQSWVLIDQRVTFTG